MARQRAGAAFCSPLVGMDVTVATAYAEERGYTVRTVVIGSGAVLTADMKSTRVTLRVSPDGVVRDAGIY